MAERADELIDAFQQALVARDRRIFSDICAVDVHYEDPVSTIPVRGITSLTEHVSQLWAAAPDALVETSGTRLHNGRFICAPVRLKGTHTGDVGALPATRRTFDVQVLLYCELDADRQLLLRVRAFFDSYDLAVQLGVLPPKGGSAERALMVLRGFGLRLPRR